MRRDESVHYTERLEQIEETTRQISERLDQISAYQEVEALDREWDEEKESYKVSTKHGSKIPTKLESVIGGIFITGFGIFWTIMAGMAFPPLALVGLFFVGFGLFQAVSCYSKAEKYQLAEKRYRRRRRDLLAAVEDETQPVERE